LLQGEKHLKEFFDSIIAKGGEGVMLRKPQSEYKAGRSESLRKFKPYFDTEVKVIENNYPHGFNCLQYVYFESTFQVMHVG
jgi:DNA ligase-1